MLYSLHFPFLFWRRTMTKPATTTPDPEFNIPASGEPYRKQKPPDNRPEQAAQNSGSGSAPGSGEQDEKPAAENGKKTLGNRGESMRRQEDGQLKGWAHQIGERLREE